VDQSEVDRLEQERREGENRDAHVALPQVPLPPAFERWLVIRKVLLWAGLVLGVGILLFGHVIPWATVLVVVRRAWKGRWLGAVILSVAWVVAVLITLAVHPIAP
jgi:hypothetical protein